MKLHRFPVWRFVWRWWQRLDLLGLRKLAELEEIGRQMDFWHAEEVRAMDAVIDACDRKDWEAYGKCRLAYETVVRRSRREVTEPLQRMGLLREEDQRQVNLQNHDRYDTDAV